VDVYEDADKDVQAEIAAAAEAVAIVDRRIDKQANTWID
jgi:hypothetical protein